MADIEWMVLPPVAAGQFYVVEALHKERGFRVPVALVTWAFVSEEVDRSLHQAGSSRRLRPDQWKCGEIGWLIDAVGDSKALDAGLQWLKTGPFKERPLSLIMRDKQGSATASTLDALLAGRTGSAVA